MWVSSRRNPPNVGVVWNQNISVLSEGTVGEIWIRSKSRAMGYWSRPDKTLEEFGGRLDGSSKVSKPAVPGETSVPAGA